MSKPHQANLGIRIQAALTEQEIAQLLDALLGVISDELWQKVITQLLPDTQQTLQEICHPTPTSEQVEPDKTPPVSQAKLAEIWAKLWQEWDKIIDKAAEEEGPYLTQEAEWEEPYFDANLLVENLEKVAEKMQPLIQVAFENEFVPQSGFASVLLEAEQEISANLPDWMEIIDGISLEYFVTTCLLQWEWLTVKSKEQEPFQFAEQIRELEENFEYINFNGDIILSFLVNLTDSEQKSILTGLQTHREHKSWKSYLDNTNSHWHDFYLEALEKYASPEIYLANLRATIPQQWENGLPVIQDLLDKQDYSQSLTVIKETLAALFATNRQTVSWQPETTLLNLIVSWNYHEQGNQGCKNLLRYYEQTSQGLGQSELARVLEIHRIAFDKFYDWSTMFKTFAEADISPSTRLSLFASWRDHLVKRSQSFSYFSVKSVEPWWLHWLIDSIVNSELGITWFREKIQQWFINLPRVQQLSSEEYHALCLLTKDLTEIYYHNNFPYPKFNQVVLGKSSRLSFHDDDSRRAYLKEYAPNNFWDSLMDYWRSQLHYLVPKPELCQNSNYREHAEWMFALQEIAPDSYETLLAEWRVKHRRRINLWKVMK